MAKSNGLLLLLTNPPKTVCSDNMPALPSVEWTSGRLMYHSHTKTYWKVSTDGMTWVAELPVKSAEFGRYELVVKYPRHTEFGRARVRSYDMETNITTLDLSKIKDEEHLEWLLDGISSDVKRQLDHKKNTEHVSGMTRGKLEELIAEAVAKAIADKDKK